MDLLMIGLPSRGNRKSDLSGVETSQIKFGRKMRSGNNNKTLGALKVILLAITEIFHRH
jgi:hypothetical protein